MNLGILDLDQLYLVLSMRLYSELVSIFLNTRMHSSRMRTVRCSGHLGGGCPGGCLPGGMSALGRVSARGCLAGGVLQGVSGRGVSVWVGVCVCQGVSAWGSVSLGDVHLPLVDRILDTCL